jgi:hypothetical protein
VKRIFGIVFGSVRQIQRQGWYTVYYLFTAKKNENQELRQTVYDLNTSLGPHQRNEELKYRIPGCLPFLQHCHVAKTPNTFCCAVQCAHTHKHTPPHTQTHTIPMEFSDSLWLVQYELYIHQLQRVVGGGVLLGYINCGGTKWGPSMLNEPRRTTRMSTRMVTPFVNCTGEKNAVKNY